MSVCAHIEGIAEPSPEFHKKAEAWRACEAAGVDIPKELREYFADEPPDPMGVVHDMGSLEYPKAPYAVKYSGNYELGVVLDLSKLPPGVTKLRVVYR